MAVGAATDAEKSAHIRALIRKIARQAGKDYLFFPALSLRRWRRTLTANLAANLLRNVWAYMVICCGHFVDGAEKFTPAALEAAGSPVPTHLAHHFQDGASGPVPDRHLR